MKRILLLTALLLGTVGMRAQSKATATVNLLTGMTAKLELNNTTTTATLTFSGPSDRWFGLQIGSFGNNGGMQEGSDVVYYNGTTLIDAFQNGVGAIPSVDTNNWTMTSNTVVGTTRTIVATRAFNTGSTDDYTIVYADPNIDFAYARALTATYAMLSHGSNFGYSLNNTFNCIAPPAPTATAQTFCAGATVANLVVTGTAGATFKWYATSTAATPLATTTVLTNGTNYYATQVVGDCESTARTTVAVNITTVPLPTAQNNFEFCSPKTVAALTATGQPGATFKWYTTLTGGTPLVSTAALPAGTYYVSQTVGDCTSARREVHVIYFTIAKPTVPDTTLEFCSEKRISDLTATGQPGAIFKWYENATGGDVLAGTTVLAAGNYFVSQTVGDCVSERQEVTITYAPLAKPSVPDETPSVCPGTTVANLTVTGAAGAVFKWYTTEEGGEPLAGTTPVVAGNYYVSQTVGECVSTRRHVIVSIEVLPIPEAEHNQTFCEGATVEDLVATGLAGSVIRWHKPQTSAPLAGNTILVAGPYYVRQMANGCESAFKEVVVTLLPKPAAPGGAATQTFEEGETVSDFTISILVDAVVKWYIMDGGQLVLVPATQPLVDGKEYFVTQTVGDCESEPLKITADKVLSNTAFDFKALMVYPNPVTDVLTVSNKDVISQITVINLLGQTVISQKAYSDKVEINTSKLQNGTYLLKVTTSYGEAVLKVIK
jgi:hypothetical protein